MEFEHPTSVRVLPNHHLELGFKNGKARLFDVTPYLSRPYYSSLNNPHIFNTARIDHGTVVWAGDIDIAPDDLYFNGEERDTVLADGN
jgi:hypothetical protein